jgi:hypothetical protein
MARTLSDTLIIAMIEASTRLAAGRGPIGPSGSGAGSAGSAAAGSAGAVAAPATGETGATATTAPPDTSVGAGALNGGGASLAAGSGGDKDPRTAEQMAADFRTIYQAIEEVVRISAEQETKSVGFAPR